MLIFYLQMIDVEKLTSSFCFPDVDSLQPHSYYNGLALFPLEPLSSHLSRFFLMQQLVRTTLLSNFKMDPCFPLTYL